MCEERGVSPLCSRSNGEHLFYRLIYEACPESKDTVVLNMYNIFNLQK
jgi:hypothetical protein